LREREVIEDAELVAGALAGGPEAFEPIVRRYQDAVFGVALARLGDFHDAEDVAQTAFVEAYRNLGDLATPSRLGAWLRSIAIHKSIDLLRRRRERPRDDVMDGLRDKSAPPPEQAIRRELRQAVMAAVSALSRPQRETVTLFYVNGYSYADVARIQEVPVGTVKRRLHDARKRLEKDMMAMVEDVLKSEGPDEDFAARVFQVLSVRRPRTGEAMPWRQMVAELQRIGDRGVGGFSRALASEYSQTRIAAAGMIRMAESARTREDVVGMIKAALDDPNKKVRRNAVDALFRLEVSDDRRRAEFVPLILARLADPSKRVRKRAAYLLELYVPVVPWQPAVRALVDERDADVRGAMSQMVRAILKAQPAPEGKEQP